MVTKILLFPSSLTIHSLHFPFLTPLQLTLMIFLMLSLALTIPEQEKRSYWCMEGRIATGTNESRTRTSYRGYPRSQRSEPRGSSSSDDSTRESTIPSTETSSLRTRTSLVPCAISCKARTKQSVRDPAIRLITTGAANESNSATIELPTLLEITTSEFPI